MDPNHPQLRELFIAACDLSEAEQKEFVDKHCSDHPELGEQLRRLLRSDGKTGGVFSDNKTTHGIRIQLDTVLENELPAQDVGSRYQLLGEIARGGMGAIVEGRDNELGRDLAIKVLLDEHKDNPQIVQRFLEEAQIGSQLQHPGIAPIYEVGQLQDGRPFISMKLVKGKTLATLLMKRKNTADERGKFIGIFEQVCQTLAYAHSRGVIHRDLKPANIMVGAFGEVQVMDWGLAKVLSKHGIADETQPNEQTTTDLIQTLRSSEPKGIGSPTQAGSVMGTPAYMPPEQALGKTAQLDQRSDVFGLGAILCEILTGERIYTNQDNSQILKLASRGELTNCFERLDACKADCELVALTKDCLCTKQDDRPQNAGVLAERINDYLESVETRLRETEIDRAAQSARADEERKRRRVTLALAATVLLMLGLGAAGWIYLEKLRTNRIATTVSRINDSLNDARLHQSLATAADSEIAPDLDFQLRELKQALASAEDAAKQAESNDVEASLRTTSQQLHAELEKKSLLAQQLADQAEFDQSLMEKLELIRLTNGRGLSPDELLAQNTRDAKHETLPEFLLADLSDAPLMYEKVFREAGFDFHSKNIENTTAKIQNSTIRESLISALDNWLRAIPEVSDRNEIDQPGNGVQVTRSHLLALVNAADSSQWRRKLRTALAAGDTSLLRQMAAEEQVQEQPNELICWLGAALRQARAIEESVSILRQAQQRSPGDFWLNYELGTTLPLMKGKDIEGLTYLRAAMAIRPRSTGTLAELSKSLRSLKRYEEANSADRRALEIDPKFLFAFQNLGDTLYHQERYDDALLEYQKAIDISPDNPRPYMNRGACFAKKQMVEEAMAAFEKAIDIDPNYALAHGNLGDLFMNQGETGKAIEAYRKMIELYPSSVSSYYNIGVCLIRQGKTEEAIKEFQKAIDIEPQNAGAFAGLGSSYTSQGQLDKAIAAYRTAIEFDPAIVKAHSNLGHCLMVQNKFDEAIDEYREALDLDPDFSYAHYVIGYMRDEQGKLEEAITEYRKAIEITPKFSECFVNIGLILRSQGKTDAAITEYNKAIEANSNTTAVANAYNNLASCYTDKGNVDEAINAYRKSLAIIPGRANSRVKLGMALQSQGNLEEAIIEYRAAAKIKPRSLATSEAHYFLGLALSDRDNSDEAMAEYRTAIRLDPKYALARVSLGLELCKQGMPDQAKLEFEKVEKLVPEDAGIFQGLAYDLLTIQDKTGQFLDTNEGLRFATKANNLVPDNGRCLMTLGIAQYRNEQWELALASLEASAESTEETNVYEIESTLFMAMTLWKLERPDEAREFYSKAIELKTNRSLNARRDKIFNEAKALLAEDDSDIKRPEPKPSDDAGN